METTDYNSEPIRYQQVPRYVRINWHDYNRGSTSFVLEVGKHIDAATFLKNNDRGELWVEVWHWLGDGPPDQDLPHAPQWHFAYQLLGARPTEESEDWFEPDIQWPTLEDQANGLEVIWPSSRKMPCCC